MKKACLPDVDRRDVGTVLDLASGEMLFNPGGTNEAPILDYFDKMGRGDIGWDGVLLTLRGARVSEFKDGGWVPLTPKRESRGCGAYPMV